MIAPQTSAPWEEMLRPAQRRFLEELIYEPKTGLFRWRRSGRGRTKRKGAVAGCPHTNGYVRICVNGRTYFAHRLAFMFMLGRFPPFEVDHVNGVRNDNRWSNLREATIAENRRSTPGAPARRKASRFKGVTREHHSMRWCAQITCDHVTYRLGHFDLEEDAAEAYRRAAVELHGEFAQW